MTERAERRSKAVNNDPWYCTWCEAVVSAPDANNLIICPVCGTRGGTQDGKHRGRINVIATTACHEIHEVKLHA